MDRGNGTSGSVSVSSATKNTALNSSSSNSNSLKIPLTQADKDGVRAIFESLDPAKFWYLDATKGLAAKQQIEPESVEQKVFKFALECNYHHPCHSFVLDLSDDHWESVFTPAEHEELLNTGAPLPRPLPQGLDEQLQRLSCLKEASTAFKHGRRLEYDEEDEPLMVWLSKTLMDASYLFIKEDDHKVSDMMETDKLYYQWGSLNTIFWGSEIRAASKERCSTANATAKNKKRKLPAIEGIDPSKMGRKMDTVYSSGKHELGCLEIGGCRDSTKTIKDGKVEMPVVMKDMLLSILSSTTTKPQDIHILGYNINADDITMMVLDSPKGYIVRVRHLQELPFPSSKKDFVPHFIPLL